MEIKKNSYKSFTVSFYNGYTGWNSWHSIKEQNTDIEVIHIHYDRQQQQQQHHAVGAVPFMKKIWFALMT